MMDGNSKSTRMKILKQKLMLIESQSTLMSPSIAFPRVRSSSSNSDVGGGGGVEGGGKGGSLMFDLGDAYADQSNLDVSGLAPLDESVFEASSIHCQNFFPPPPSLPPHRHVSPTDGGRGGGGRVRHASDWNLSSSTAEAKRGEVSRGNHFDDANFNCGLTLPTSASKKKPGMRSYMSTPDTRALAGEFGGVNPMMTGGDETGPRKRSLGKARRVLKTSPKEDEDTVKEKTKIGGLPSSSAPIEFGLASKSEENIPRRCSLGTINEFEDGILQAMKGDDLILSDLRLTDDLRLDDPDLNTTFEEYSSDGDLMLNDVENRVDDLHSARGKHAAAAATPARVVKKSPLQEINCQDGKNRVNFSEHFDTLDVSHPASRQFHRPNNNAAPAFPQTPMQKNIPSQNASNKSAYQQQQQQHHHSVLKTPLNSMRPPQMPLFTPAQPMMPQHLQQPYPRKQKFVQVNGIPYQLIRQIGSGGSCKVHQAADFEKQRLVAIKIVDLDDVDQTMIDSYKNEINILLKLQHSNRVVKLIDHEIVRHSGDNLLYIVMECGDCDLATIFNERVLRKNITRNLVRYYWEEMLSCIAVIHAEGIVHSDLKPANFLLVNGTLKLIDFGIANAIQSDKTSITRDSQIGTLNYMSPEAILDTQPPTEEDEEEGKPRIKIGTKSDVWSLGCILYSMVYAKTPFHHLTNHLSKIQAIINPRYNIKFGEDSNKHLLDVMQKCFNREPKARPSVDDLLAHPYLSS